MKKLTLIAIILGISLISCKDTTNLLPNVTGKSGEVIVIIEPDLWDSKTGTLLKDIFTQPYPGLPQNEPLFDLVHIPYASFSNIFKTHRNLIFIKLEEDAHEAKVVVEKDRWAKPQLIMHVVAPDKQSLENLLAEKGGVLIDRVIRKEMGRYRDNYKKYEELEITGRLAKKFGIKMTVPKGYSIDVDSSDFMWIENRGHGDLIQGILIFQYPKPNVEVNDFYIAAKRDQFTKKYVPGPNPNTYMVIERELFPQSRDITINKIKGKELRGLWKVENDFMGGPFVSFTFIEENSNLVTHIDAFVYAPQVDKRDYMRQLEAILNTLEKIDEPAN